MCPASPLLQEAFGRSELQKYSGFDVNPMFSERFGSTNGRETMESAINGAASGVD